MTDRPQASMERRCTHSEIHAVPAMTTLMPCAPVDNPDHAHDVDIVMANHLALVIACQLRTGTKEGFRQAELVIPRKHCRGNRPTRRGLWAAAADLMRYRQDGRRLEVLARLDGVVTPVLCLPA